ncbi:RHS repeat-associated core domain-containing protein [Parahaliea aestuarii]|nr:RHS repeat-associated core domain-containing protein [Parahaliea aestuarii]
MNGRGYDYNLGRFLSVDPFIVEPGNTQAINPYSYVLNNPLSGVDPTGYTKEKVEKNMVRVEKTGSRIQREVTVTTTTTQNDDGSTTIAGSVSGGLMSDREAVSNGLSNYFQAAGFNEVTSGPSSGGIGGQQTRRNVSVSDELAINANQAELIEHGESQIEDSDEDWWSGYEMPENMRNPSENTIAMDLQTEIFLDRVLYGDKKAGIMRSQCYQDCKRALEEAQSSEIVGDPSWDKSLGKGSPYRKLLMKIIDTDPRIELLIKYGEIINTDRVCSSLVDAGSLTCK